MSNEKIHPVELLRSAADTAEGLRLFAGVDTTGNFENGVPYRISDETPNSYGVVVNNDGLDISSHSGQEGGPVLLEHGKFEGQGSIPIGLGKAFKVGNETHALVRFDEKDPVAVRIKGLVERRVMRNASISIHFSPEDIVEKDGLPPVVSKSKMFEFSAVGIGSNPNAMSLSQSLRSAKLEDGLEGSMVALEDAANRLSILALKLGISQDQLCGDISFLEGFEAKAERPAPASVLVDMNEYASLSARVYLGEGSEEDASKEFLELGFSPPWASSPESWEKAKEFKGKEGADVALSALGFGEVARLVKAKQDGVCPSCNLSESIVRKADMTAAIGGAIELIKETFQKPGSLTYVGGKLKGVEP